MKIQRDFSSLDKCHQVEYTGSGAFANGRTLIHQNNTETTNQLKPHKR